VLRFATSSLLYAHPLASWVCFRAGLDDYLPKPIIQAAVLKMAEKWVRNGGKLPGLDVDNLHSEQTDSAASPTNATPKLRVLLAEDNRANTFAITRLIEKHGLEVVAVVNGEEALGAVRDQARFDLCLMDLHMPIMDGIQATHAIREFEAGKNESRPLAIVGLTATLGPAEEQICMDAGMDASGEKPLNPIKFREWIHKFAGVHVEMVTLQKVAAKPEVKVEQSTRDTHDFDLDMEWVHAEKSDDEAEKEKPNSEWTTSCISSPTGEMNPLPDLKMARQPHTKEHHTLDGSRSAENLGAMRDEPATQKPVKPADVNMALREVNREKSDGSNSYSGVDNSPSELRSDRSPRSSHSEEDSSEEGPTPTVNKNILVVEDNMVSQKLMKLMLERDGWIVHTAENGQIGVDKTAEIDFACVLMDCDMPIKDGWQATREIRQREAKRDTQWVPIIAVTANAMAGDRQKCIAAGMDDYISKPVQRKPVLVAVKTWAAKRSKRYAKSSSKKPSSDASRRSLSTKKGGGSQLMERIVENDPPMPKILLCDSSPYCRALAGAIADMGFNVTLVLNMRDALELVQNIKLFHNVIVTPSFSDDLASVQKLQVAIRSRLPLDSQRNLELLITSFPSADTSASKSHFSPEAGGTAMEKSCES
jgi:CheY-like chemotaxis protein